MHCHVNGNVGSRTLKASHRLLLLAWSVQLVVFTFNYTKTEELGGNFEYNYFHF